MKLDSINRNQRVYIMPCGGGYSCYGFDVLYNKLHALANAMGIEVKSKRKGTKKQFFEYSKIVDLARRSGKRFDIDLYMPFIGLEGKRVEVTRKDGTKRRFYIGKSTGFMPIHLEIPQRNSIGGMCVIEDFVSFKVLY